MDVVQSSFQLHFFTDNSDIEAKPSIVNKLLKNMPGIDFMPETMMEFNPITGEKRKTISFVNEDDSLRVDFNINDIFIHGTRMSIESFYESAMNVLDGIYQVFEYKSANRISIVSASIYRGDVAEYDSLYGRIFTYKEETPFEWVNRIVRRKKIDSENINLVTSLRRLKVQLNDGADRELIDAVVKEVDINTVAENRAPRFLIQDAKAKFECLKKMLVEENQLLEYHRLNAE